MSASRKNTNSDFKSTEEALKFLLQKSQEEELKKRWKEEMDHLPNPKRVEKLPKKRMWLYSLTAVAVSFLVVLSFYFLFNQDHSDAYRLAEAMIHETNFVLGSDLETRSLGGENAELADIKLKKQLSKMMIAKDYASAIKIYAAREKLGLSKAEQFAYALALARSENGDLTKAKKLLEEFQSTNKFINPEALWLQGLIYLKTGERKKSKIVLNKLIKNSNYQSNNAKVLLKKMAD